MARGKKRVTGKKSSKGKKKMLKKGMIPGNLAGQY